jgi:Tfp pilus assembly protein PilZ
VTLSSETHFLTELAGRQPVAGIFIQTQLRLCVGRRVGLLLSMPSGEVEGLGVVRWTQPASASASGGVGVALEGLPPEGRDRVESFCRLQAPVHLGRACD